MSDNESTTTPSATESTATPPAPVTGRWADEPDDVPETSDAALAIDESKRVNDFLDDPDDSRIQAVTSGDTVTLEMIYEEQLALRELISQMARVIVLLAQRQQIHVPAELMGAIGMGSAGAGSSGAGSSGARGGGGDDEDDVEDEE